jgi:ATP-dependent DNA ligase
MGYEGLIIRQGEYGYEDGKRSRSLIKVKKCFDDEFLVVDIHESVDGWAILECAVDNEETFRVSAPGSMADKFYVALSKDEYIGRFVTVEYFEITNAGKPFHPVAIGWKEEL